jgi:alpha-L-rhamnosidase
MPRYVYGDRLALLAQLHLEYENGEVEVIGTDERWDCIPEGPYLQTDNLDGEILATDRLVTWHDAAGWTRPRVAAHDKKRIVMQSHPPCRVERLLPLKTKKVVSGKVVLDFGQNFAGVVRLKFTAPKGTVIEIRHAEMLQEDGSLYTANLRDLKATDRVTATGEAGQVYEPLFTFHGFRYAEVSGITSDQVEDAKGVVLTNMPEETGSFLCSNDRLNQLWSNSAWTMRSNFLAVPTDCPQRDERLGWTGDIQVFARSATYYADVEAFLEKWCADMRDAQLPDGRYPDIAPHLAPSHAPGSFTGVPAWGDAGVIVPWRLYETYGNKRLLERHFESARRWVDWIDQSNPDHIWRKNRGNDYNDWLNGDTLIADDYPKTGGAIPNELFASLMFAQSAKLLSQMAEVLGRPESERYRQLFSSIQAAIEKEFIQSDNTVKGDTQAGYGLCLNILELSEDRRRGLAERLKAAIAKYDERISTGFVSTVPMMQQLVRQGMVHEAFGLLTSRRFPSWLYSVDQGATTIWERWDGWVAGRGFQNPGMNSFNHYAIGAVAEFMMEHVGGIKVVGAIVDRRFRIAPLPAGGITWAKAKWPTRLGDVRCDWSIDDDVWVIRFVVPPNSAAEVVLPTSVSDLIDAGGLTWKDAGNGSTATAVAGEYTVRVRWRKR